jgi:glycosyltransferase involved in cell wall biosynthesis
VRVALLAPVLSARDAVGTDVLEMAAALRADGRDVRLYAEHAQDVAETVHAPAGLPGWLGAPEDVCLYHHSIGWPRALELLRRLRARRVVRYHNVTPAEFFVGISREHVRACAAGRALLADLVALAPQAWLACSRYNAEEIAALGAEPARIAVLPPFHRIERLLQTAPDFDLLDRYRGGPCTWLNVGRLAPNKDHATLIEAFALYVARYERDARLLLVGKIDARLRRYTRALRARIAARGLDAQVQLLGEVSESGLVACYLAADALVIPSRHEGFCVPLAEAMALSVPVIARAATALPDTLGDAGIAWTEDDPRLYAASVARLRADPVARDQLTAAGRARQRRHFATGVLAQRLRQFVDTLA